MTSDEVLNIFKKTGGYITRSHIVLTSGKHTDAYLNKDAIYPHTEDISEICLAIAEKFIDKDIEVVAAPALGGIILSQWTAYHLSKLTHKEVLGVYTEKNPDKNLSEQTGQIFTRGYDKLIIGKNVLVVEDITTTGGSVKKVIESVKRADGKVSAVCVLVNRDPEKINSQTLGVNFYPLVEIKVQAWDEADCPLCKKGIPVNTDIAHGKEYIQKGKIHFGH